MSETSQAATSSWRRLKAALITADEDARWAFGFWMTGFAVMGTAIILQFGWQGALFCFGLLLWTAGRH